MNAVSHKVAGKSDVGDLLATARWPSANRFRDLLEVGREAVRLEPPDYVRSVFGSPASWLR